MSDTEPQDSEFDADGHCSIHGEDCEERDHTCGCGECCDACWFDCCASREGIDTWVDIGRDLGMEITNCGFVPQDQLDFLVNEWDTPAWLAKIDT